MRAPPEIVAVHPTKTKPSHAMEGRLPEEQPKSTSIRARVEAIVFESYY